MLPQDKINKTSWTLHESAKDAIARNIVDACRGGQLKIEAASVEKLLAVISASADEGYHRGHKNFMTTVKAALEEEAEKARLDESLPALKKDAKQKK